jgi:dTDP-4-dehydrorhamnose 3,5-epimerase
MTFTPTKIPGAYIIGREPRTDERGSFARMFCKHELEAAGLCGDIAQVNISTNSKRGTLRGLHSQKAKYAEDKLVTCVSGAIYDVCVDVRPESPMYKQWIGTELTADNGHALYIPKGCAHGYLTLMDDTQTLYFVSQFYAPDSEVGYRYDDPAFAIDWERWVAPPYVMSKKDKKIRKL